MAFLGQAKVEGRMGYCVRAWSNEASRLTGIEAPAGRSPARQCERLKGPRMKKGKALVAPDTQVTRVQIPALTNFSGHTEFWAHSGLCARQFPDLPG
eukprot:jgi/Chrzof1/5984/UNPLg00830.t1